MGAAFSHARRGVVAGLTLGAGGLALTVLLAACSNGGGKPAAATSSAASSSSANASATGNASDANAAFRDCLQQHGVTLPSFSGRPSGVAGSRRPRPTGSFSRPAGGFSRPPGGGGFGGFGGSANPSQQAALQACASLRPTGSAGFGGFGGGASISATTFASFKSCMAGAGVTITQTDPVAALRALNRSDATTAKALATCQAILGSAAANLGGPRASGSPASS